MCVCGGRGGGGGGVKRSKKTGAVWTLIFDCDIFWNVQSF